MSEMQMSAPLSNVPSHWAHFLEIQSPGVSLPILDPQRIPRHVAIIPDGNRRWASNRLLQASEGHKEGADTLMEIVKTAQVLGVSTLSFYAFSTENWSRPKHEVDALMSLFADYLAGNIETMIEWGIRLDTIGDLTPIPRFLRDVIDETKRRTASCHKINLVLALNYGGRNEICRALKAMMQDSMKGHLSIEEISEKTVGAYLDTHALGDPDLLIRTSGEFRISNFLLWQLSYTEIYVADVLWPSFTPRHFLDALVNFQQRERRLGGA